MVSVATHSTANSTTRPWLSKLPRRGLFFIATILYSFWIASMHHTASDWVRPETLFVSGGGFLAAELLIAPFETRGGNLPISKTTEMDASSSSASFTRKVKKDSITIVHDHGNEPLSEEKTSEETVHHGSASTERSLSHQNDKQYNLSINVKEGSMNGSLVDKRGRTLIPTPCASCVSQQFTLSVSQGPKCSALMLQDVAFTLVTQCDDERIPMIAHHCMRWNGPISVAVFSNRSVEDISTELAGTSCAEKILFIDTLIPSDDLSADSYPVNHLRNMAINNVNTSHFVYMDIDFLPNDELESILLSNEVRSVVAVDHKHALVIPAFEYKPKCQSCSSQEALLSQMPRSKAELTRLHETGEASMFHDYWPAAHDSTDYDVWKEQEPGSLVSIPCIKSDHYEPYLILRKCRELPPFQEAFMGYGYNKASFTMQLQAMQYRFSQVGGSFCTHFPHTVSKARATFDQTKAKKWGQRLRIESLVKNYTHWLNQTYGQRPPKVPYCKQDVKASGESQSSETESSAPIKVPFLAESTALPVCQNVEAKDVTYSLVVQCSDDRLWMMEHHCQRWSVNNAQPSLSLVVYTNETLREIKLMLQRMNCPVDSGLTVQIFPKIYKAKDYPVNKFRNDAFAAVKTTHAVHLDIDFLTSTNLFTTLDTPTIRSKLAESIQHAMVVPAFQLQPQCPSTANDADCPDHHIPLMPKIKDNEMISSLENGTITVFNILQNKDGHGSTRYDVWMNQSSEDWLEIPCVKSNRYEPYLVVRVCRDLPPFQPVFKGYGKNKISWILHLRHLGWKFFQLGEAFAIHFPHLESKAKTVWRTQRIENASSHSSISMEESMRAQNDKLFEEFRQWLETAVSNRTKTFKCRGLDAAHS